MAQDGTRQMAREVAHAAAAEAEGLSQRERDALEIVLVDRIEQKFRDRERSRWQTLGLIGTAIGLLGTGLVLVAINSAANLAVDTRLGKMQAEVESAKKYTRMLNLSTKLSLADGFSESDRNAIVESFKQVKDDPTITSEPTFPSTLENVIDALFQADNTEGDYPLDARI